MTHISRSTELTDIDGTALTITQTDGGAYVSATDGDDEVTAGPFTAEQLRDALPTPAPSSDLLEAVAVALCSPHRAEQVWPLLSEVERAEHRAAARRAFAIVSGGGAR